MPTQVLTTKMSNQVLIQTRVIVKNLEKINFMFFNTKNLTLAFKMILLNQQSLTEIFSIINGLPAQPFHNQTMYDYQVC